MKQSVNQDQLPLTVGILIYENVEVLDVTGPFEVFSVTRLKEQNRFEVSSPFKVILIAETFDQVIAFGGLRLTPDFTFNTCPKLDLLIIPGGYGTRKEVKNEAILKWISTKIPQSKLTASVCTGSSLIGKTGLLDNRLATTHWNAFNFLQESAPRTHIMKNVRFTLEEPIFTSAGVSHGIDLSLYIVSYFLGMEIGHATARYMDYPYPD
jgi:transcriptional regulator GlxA family with amidase domain